MATRQPTQAELNTLLSSGTATIEALIALGIEAAATTANDTETTGDGNVGCKKCHECTGCNVCRSCSKCSNCRNCEKCHNCTSCDDSTWLGSADAANGCHHCSGCHGSDPATEGGARAVKLYYCRNLVKCSRCLWTENVSGGRNMIYGVQVTAARFDVAEALVRASLGLA